MDAPANGIPASSNPPRVAPGASFRFEHPSAALGETGTAKGPRAPGLEPIAGK